jgi:hypothetical protein
MPLIGNRYELAFELIPVAPTWETRYPPESAAWAGLAIWVDNKNLCSHVVPGTSDVRDYLYVPLGPLADWVVRAFPAIEYEERPPRFQPGDSPYWGLDAWATAAHPADMDEDAWIQEREEWWQRHFLAAGADGARVPNVAFVRADEKMVIEWRPPRLVTRPTLVMLYPEGRTVVPWRDGASTLKAFVSFVRSSIRGTDAECAFPWAEEEARLEPPMEQALELLTGRRLSELRTLFEVDGDAELIEVLDLSSQDDPAAAPQCQMLRDASPGISEDIAVALREVGGRALRDDVDARQSWERMRATSRDAARAASTREQAGQAAANAVRDKLGLDGQPIENLPDVLEASGLEWRHLEGVQGINDRMLVGVRQDGAPAAGTLDVPRLGEPWARSFEAARALGHVLLDPLRAGAIGATSGAFSQASRRRRSGAFAAELLLPQTALARESHYQLDGIAHGNRFPEMLEKYGVGANTAAHQALNRGWLSSEYVRDGLIEQYAHSA